VQDLMTQLINGGVARDLDTAYEKACKLHPDIASQVEVKTNESDAARMAISAKKAKLAAKRPTGKHAGAVTRKTSIEEELGAAYDEQAA